MTITIPQEVLKETGLTERELLIEIACRLFDADRLAFHTARRMAGLGRVEFEIELRKRKIAIFRPTDEDWEEDLRTIRHLEGKA